MSRRRWSILAILAFLFIGATLVLVHNQREATRGNSLGSTADISSSILASPGALAADSNGNIYVNEQKQNRILKISASRYVTIVAGSGRRGFSGDGGPADQASLASPTSIALDSAGNLFIADTGNSRIRRIDAKTHTITTVPGNSFQHEWNTRIAKYTATSPGTYPPISIAVDGDENLYIGGVDGVGILRVDPVSHSSTVIVGVGLPGYPVAPYPSARPSWLAVDEHGTLLFSDPYRNAVSLINTPGNDVHRVAGGAVCGFAGDGGPAIGALLCFPKALAVSRDKKLFISDTGNNRIRQVDLSTGIITTAAGNGQIGDAGDGGPAINASLNNPMGIAVDGKGNLYIADTGNNCIRRLDTRTGLIASWATARDLELAKYAQSTPFQ
jgi:sugar lactone lactonase YvrE